MNNIVGALVLFGSLSFAVLACSNGSTQHLDEKKNSKSNPKNEVIDSFMVDARDNEQYKIVQIGEQLWLAENLRYECEGSFFNDKNPSKEYGRYYTLSAAQSACPKGWHLPTDIEWDSLEIAHGMPASFVGKGGWRGEHAANLKSKQGWDETPDEQLKEGWTKIGNGINLLGFNVLPAGYYFSEELGEDVGGMQGERNSAAFWSAQQTVAENNSIIKQAFARFMFGSRVFVNKWPDTNDDSGAALSCRCVKD